MQKTHLLCEVVVMPLVHAFRPRVRRVIDGEECFRVVRIHIGVLDSGLVATKLQSVGNEAIVLRGELSKDSE